MKVLRLKYSTFRRQIYQGGGVSEITKGMNNLNAWGITNTNLVVLTNCLHCTVHAMKNVLNQGLFFFCINNY